MHKHKGRGKKSKHSNRSDIDYDDQNSRCCWICQLEDNPHHNHLTRTLEAFCLQQRFQPCLCKGSMQNVHKECLNLWVKERYTTLQKNHKISTLTNNDEDSLPDISCPNCKYLYNYTVHQHQTYRFPKLKDIRWLSMESITLLVLMFFQIVLLVLDMNLSKSAIESKTVNENSIIKVTSAIHVITALIIIFAACYNVFQTIAIEIMIEVHDKEAEISD